MYRIKQCTLLVGDMVSFVAGLWLALYVRRLAQPSLDDFNEHVGLFLVLFFFWIVVNYINGLYDLERHKNNLGFYRLMFQTMLFSLVLSIVFFYILPEARLTPKTILLLTISIGYGLAASWRFLFNVSLSAERLRTNIILVGYSKETQEIIDLLARYPEKGYAIVALIDPEGTVKPATVPINVLHGLQTIRPAISTYKANVIVMNPDIQKNDAALRELYELLFWDVEIANLMSFYEMVTGRIPPSTFSEGWFLEHLRRPMNPLYEHVRRIMDYVVALLVGIVFIILFPFIAAAIKLGSKGPLFIRQQRVGYAGKPFTLYKFRSMYALSPDGSAEINGVVQFAKKDDERITPIGRLLRKTRLDELPQVWNLLKQDVTLIGPRPERPEIVNELEGRMPYYPLRHMVRPGLTGWALIQQNYTDTYDTSLEKLQYDLYYIKNRSWLLDMVILLRTVNVIARLMGQ